MYGAPPGSNCTSSCTKSASFESCFFLLQLFGAMWIVRAIQYRSLAARISAACNLPVPATSGSAYQPPFPVVAYPAHAYPPAEYPVALPAPYPAPGPNGYGYGG